MQGVSAVSHARRAIPEDADASLGSAGWAVEARSAALVVGAAAAAAVLASVFQLSAEWVLERLHGAREPVSAARAAACWVVLVSVAGALPYAALAARAARKFGSGQTGSHQRGQKRSTRQKPRYWSEAEVLVEPEHDTWMLANLLAGQHDTRHEAVAVVAVLANG